MYFFNSWENKNRYSTIALRNLISIARFHLPTSLQSRNIYCHSTTLHYLSAIYVFKSYPTFLASSLDFFYPNRRPIEYNDDEDDDKVQTVWCKNLPLLKSLKLDRESAATVRRECTKIPVIGWSVFLLLFPHFSFNNFSLSPLIYVTYNICLSSFLLWTIAFVIVLGKDLKIY